MSGFVGRVREAAGEVEGALVDVAARVAPWAAPVPTAYLVGRATVVHLGWPVAVGVVTAMAVEGLGLATTATALELREYNAGKRKSDPAAPFWLAAVLVGVYVVVAVGLTVALDIVPGLVGYAPAVFPGLSLVGVTVLALRGDHRRRVAGIEVERAERRAKRAASRGTSRGASRGVSMAVQGAVQAVSRDVQDGGQAVSREGGGGVQGGVLDVLDEVNVSKRRRREQVLDAMVDVYRDSPEAGATEVAGRLGIGRSTVYVYLEELQAQGRVRKNGGGVEVVGGRE